MNDNIRPGNLATIRSYEISPRPAIRGRLTKRIFTASIVISGGLAVHSPAGKIAPGEDQLSFIAAGATVEDLDKPVRILRLSAASPISASYRPAHSDGGQADLGSPGEAGSARFGQALLSSYAAYPLADPSRAIDSTAARRDDRGIISVSAKPEDASGNAYTSTWIADGVLEVSAGPDVAAQLADSGADDRAEDQRSQADLAYSDNRQAEPAPSAAHAYPATVTPLQAADHDAAGGRQVAAATDPIEPLASGSARPTGTADASFAQTSRISLNLPDAQPAPGPTTAAACDDLSEGVIDTEFAGAGSAKVAVRITADNELCLRLGDVLALLESQMEKDQFERLIGSEAASDYVSSAVLREKGLTIGFDTISDKLVLGTR